MQAQQVNTANLQVIHNFLRQKNVAVPANFRDFVSSLAANPNPKRAIIQYSLLTHPDKHTNSSEEVKAQAHDVQQLINNFKNDEQLPATLQSLVKNFRLDVTQKQDYHNQLFGLAQIAKNFLHHMPALYPDVVQFNDTINRFITDIYENKHTITSVNKSTKEVEQTMVNLFTSFAKNSGVEASLVFFKQMPEALQLKIVQTINKSSPSTNFANFNNLLYANHLVFSKKLSFSQKIIQINHSFANFHPENNGFKLCMRFIKQLVEDNHLCVDKNKQVVLHENNQWIKISVTPNIKQDIERVYKQKVSQFFADAFNETSTKSIASMLESIPEDYLPRGLGEQIKKIEQTFGLKTLQSLGQLANLETHVLKDLLSKIMRDPKHINFLNLGSNSSQLEKLNALCGIFTHNQESISLTKLLRTDLNINNNQLAALIQLRTQGKLSLYRINLADKHNPTLVIFKKEGTDNLASVNPNAQALKVCQNLHAKNAHLQTITDFIYTNPRQTLVSLMNEILRHDGINEETIAQNLQATILQLFKEQKVGMGKLLQILDGKDTHILKTNQDLYQALITLQLKSNNFTIKQLKKEKQDYTGEIIEKVVLQNTNSTSKPVTVTCTPESYILLQAIQSQQAGLN